MSHTGLIDSMQIDSWDPLTFLIVCLGFFILFFVFMYSKKMLWYQQNNETDNWLTSFKERDQASGGQFRRFGRPVLVLIFIHLISYPVVTNLVVLSPVQFVIFIFVFYIPTGIILEIIMIVILRRLYRQPKVEEHEHPIEDPFPDADQS